MYFLSNQQYNQHDFHILFPKMIAFHVSSIHGKMSTTHTEKNKVAEQPAFIKGTLILDFILNCV